MSKLTKKEIEQIQKLLNRPPGENQRLAKILLQNIKDKLPVLEAYLFNIDDSLNKGIKRSESQMGFSEDMLYRYYHGSFKVYRLQDSTKIIVGMLISLDPKEDKELDYMFKEIIMASMKVGEWKIEHNKNWSKNTRPIVEAFLHAKYFLAMAVKYGSMFRNRKNPPNMLPSGWASLLSLYGIR